MSLKNYNFLDSNNLSVLIPLLDARYSIGQASNVRFGLIKLYDGTGNNVDGTMTQQAISQRLSSIYRFKGSLEDYEDLPRNPEIGDVYNIVNPNVPNHIKAGDNLAWNGIGWDNLSGLMDLSNYLQKNGEYIKSVSFNGELKTITFLLPDNTTESIILPSGLGSEDLEIQNLDLLLNVGVYPINNLSGLTNLPIQELGSLLIFSDEIFTHQLYYTLSGNFFVRVYNHSLQVWTEWSNIKTKLKQIYAETADLANPNFNDISLAVCTIENITSANNYPIAKRGLLQNVIGNLYNFQIYTTVDGQVFNRCKTNNTWSAWKEIAPTITIITSGNLNDFNEHKTYHITDTSQIITNKPDDSISAEFIVTSSEGYIYQKYINSTNTVYIRNKAIGDANFSAWKRIIDDNSITTYAPLNSASLTGTPTLSTEINKSDNSKKLANTEFVNNYTTEVLKAYAPLASPALTGNPTSTTQAISDSSTKIATTAYVKNNLANYASLTSPELTGNPTVPTQDISNNSTRVANTAYVNNLLTHTLEDYALLASPALTGNPTSTTQLKTDNSTRIATTAYVKSNLSDYMLTSTIQSTYAPLDSPTLTGEPKTPDVTAGDSTAKIANTKFVMTAIANLVNSAPESLNTLAELSSALGNDPDFATNVMTAIGEKLPIAGGEISGNLKVNGTLTATLSGNASSASKLTPGKTIQINLASTTATNFTGENNITPGVTGILGTANGGTGNANGTVAKLTNVRNLTTNLASTAAGSFDGSSDTSIGISGILGESHGGTGATSLANITVGKATYDTNGKRISEHTIEYIVGTQLSSTGAWTGTSEDSTLYTGKMIIYKLPYESSGNATLNLTLSTNETTGAKPIYKYSDVRLTTEYGANNYIPLIFNGTSWFVLADYDTTQIDKMKLSNAIANASGAITADKLVGSSNGTDYKEIISGTELNILYPIYYNELAIENNANISGSLYMVLPNVNMRNLANDLTRTWDIQKSVYLKGTLFGNTFTVHSDILTTTEPVSEDGYYYIYLGRTYSTYQMNIDLIESKIYAYRNGSFQSISLYSEKALKDSQGQQINTTYIKELSVSGKVITYTKGNGTTGTITTQDTVNTDENVSQDVSTDNNTYPVLIAATANATSDISATKVKFSSGVKINPSTSTLSATTINATTLVGNTGNTTTAGLTKLYTSTGTATDGSMTQNAIKSALDGKMDSTTNVTNVVQTKKTDNAEYPVVMVGASTQTNTTTTGVTFATGVKINPSTSTIFATTFSGNATSATKATNDSDDNPINTTYSKVTDAVNSLTADGTTITYKNKAGTSLGTFTTQDTTYSIGTADTAGITKLYTGTGTNTDGTMTQNAIKSALDGKMPSSTTVTNVIQTVKSDNATYPLLAVATVNQTTTTTAGTIFATGIKLNPSTGNITATSFTGNLTGDVTGNSATATKATNDSDDNPINTTYAKLSGATFTGGISGTTGNFSGTLTLTKTTDLSGTTNNSPALIVGGAVTSNHMEIDCNEIQAKTNETSVAQLYLNNDGGSVTIGTGGLTVNGNITASGKTITAGTFSGALTGNVTGNCSGSSGSCTGLAAKATGDKNGADITTTYETKANAITGLSLSGTTLTVTKGNSNSSTITLPTGNYYGICSTTANTVAKEVSITGYILSTGSRVTVKFTITNTADNPTLNVNSTGAKAIYYRGYPIPAEVLQANSTYDLVYNGTQYEIIGSVIWTD